MRRNPTNDSMTDCLQKRSKRRQLILNLRITTQMLPNFCARYASMMHQARKHYQSQNSKVMFRFAFPSV